MWFSGNFLSFNAAYENYAHTKTGVFRSVSGHSIRGDSTVPRLGRTSRNNIKMSSWSMRTVLMARLAWSHERQPHRVVSSRVSSFKSLTQSHGWHIAMGWWFIHKFWAKNEGHPNSLHSHDQPALVWQTAWTLLGSVPLFTSQQVIRKAISPAEANCRVTKCQNHHVRK